jgi:hypothetical protein
VVNSGSRNSVYQSLAAPERDGLIRMHSHSKRDISFMERSFASSKNQAKESRCQ